MGVATGGKTNTRDIIGWLISALCCATLAAPPCRSISARASRQALSSAVLLTSIIKMVYPQTLNGSEKLLILCRHAQSALNAARKEAIGQPWTIVTQGISQVIDPGVMDAPLTVEGQAQAQAAGNILARDIISNRIPQIDLIAVSPLRRTLHTTRLIIDGADAIYNQEQVAMPSWWKYSDELDSKISTMTPTANSRSRAYNEQGGDTPSTLAHSRSLSEQPSGVETDEEETSLVINNSKRLLTIVPYLRERRTTSADQPMVRPAQALEYWRERGVEATVANKQSVSGGNGGYLRPGTRQTLNHYLTVGLTKQCRKVNIESVESVNKRVGLLEDWVENSPQKVLLMIGHNMIFRAWQQYWRANESPVQWASREDILTRLERTRGTLSIKHFYEACVKGDRSDASTPSVSLRDRDEQMSLISGEDGTPAGTLAASMALYGVNRQKRIYECGNAEFLIVRWRPPDNNADCNRRHQRRRRRQSFSTITDDYR